ncbi:hypothetical protein RV02_GL003268 [Enterococcus gilvus]|nr:hypothetical protein RV02_GL003268 [Enterococcus gilvus]
MFSVSDGIKCDYGVDSLCSLLSHDMKSMKPSIALYFSNSSAYAV